jgi:adhesin transport system outer membrane protein
MRPRFWQGQRRGGDESCHTPPKWRFCAAVLHVWHGVGALMGLWFLRAPLWCGVAVALLAGCAPRPDLAGLRAQFDGPAELRAARVGTEIASTGFGRQVERAVLGHPQLAVASAGLRGAQARADMEARGFYPQFALSATLGTLVNGAVGGGSITPLLRVTQLVYDGGASASRQVAAQARVFETQGGQQEIAAALALSAVAGWHDLHAARARARIAAENIRAHDIALSQVQARAEAGASGSAETLTAQARLASARARAAEAAARVDRAEAGFAAVFGQRAAEDLAQPPVAPSLPDQAEDVLIAQSPRMRGLNARIAAAKADLAGVQAQRFPRIAIDGTAQRGSSRATLDVAQEPAAIGNRQARIRAAEAQLASVEAERAGLERDIARALSDLRSDQRAGAARVGAAREAVRAHRATVAAAREEFSIGRRTLLGLLDAERDLLEASEAQIAAELEVALSGYAALALTGDILDVFAIALPAPDGADD